MNRLHGSSQRSSQLRRTVALTTGTIADDSEIEAAEARVREQEAHVLRLIVQGAPTQIAEDVLRQLIARAEAVRQRKRTPRA